MRPMSIKIKAAEFVVLSTSNVRMGFALIKCTTVITIKIVMMAPMSRRIVIKRALWRNLPAKMGNV